MVYLVQLTKLFLNKRPFIFYISKMSNVKSNFGLTLRSPSTKLKTITHHPLVIFINIYSIAMKTYPELTGWCPITICKWLHCLFFGQEGLQAHTHLCCGPTLFLFKFSVLPMLTCTFSNALLAKMTFNTKMKKKVSTTMLLLICLIKSKMSKANVHVLGFR